MSKAKDWDHNCTGADCTVTGCESAAMARDLKAAGNGSITCDPRCTRQPGHKGGCSAAQSCIACGEPAIRGEICKETDGSHVVVRTVGGPSTSDLEDFRGFCRNASAAQLLQIYRKEKDAGRDEYAQVARWVAEERGVMLDEVR